MSGTVLEHPLVRDYLAELDAATRALPSGQARELREQISAHIDEALRRGADHQEVAAVLRRLGSPADLAAEAGAASMRRFRARLARVRPRAWVAAGLTAIVLLAGAVTGAARADHYLSAEPLSFQGNADPFGFQGNADWWYAQDARHEVITTAGNTTQNTTRLRPGQRQGYVVAIFNNSPVTQTILGDASGPTVLGGPDSMGSGTQIAVSRSYTDIANGRAGQTVASHVSFGLPVSIPPGQTRLVRVLWTSGRCGGGIKQLNLRVRVGWFTRSELIPMQYWYLTVPGNSNCV
jgi:hypothetical protein